jgi:hypothetical protein
MTTSPANRGEVYSGKTRPRIPCRRFAVPSAGLPGSTLVRGCRHPTLLARCGIKHRRQWPNLATRSLALPAERQRTDDVGGGRRQSTAERRHAFMIPNSSIQSAATRNRHAGKPRLVACGSSNNFPSRSARHTVRPRNPDDDTRSRTMSRRD